MTLTEYEEGILKLYKKIEDLQFPRESYLQSKDIYPLVYRQVELISHPSKPVRISEQDQLIIKTFAEDLRITLPEDFFDLGNLRKDFPRLMDTSSRFYGDSRGKMKYDKINLLLK